MVKIHNRQKRYLEISAHYGGFKHKSTKTKSFASEEAAKKWAVENKIKSYDIVVPAWGLSKKFKVVVKE